MYHANFISAPPSVSRKFYLKKNQTHLIQRTTNLVGIIFYFLPAPNPALHLGHEELDHKTAEENRYGCCRGKCRRKRMLLARHACLCKRWIITRTHTTCLFFFLQIPSHVTCQLLLSESMESVYQSACSKYCMCETLKKQHIIRPGEAINCSEQNDCCQCVNLLLTAALPQISQVLCCFLFHKCFFVPVSCFIVEKSGLSHVRHQTGGSLH